MTRVLGVVSIMVLCACGGSQTGTVKTEDGKVDWAKMDRRARIDYMKKVVVPTMGPLFKAYDSDEFGRINCLTCHGDGAIEGTYEMPNPELPQLDFGSGYAEYKAQHAQVIAFMTDTVKPKMAELLGKEVWSRDNQDGFGCQSCHVTKH